MSSIAFPASPSGALRKSSSSGQHFDPAASTSSTEPPTRTIAILAKACAKVHRLAIESKLNAAGFEILVARSEEWAYPDDVDFLYEFLHGHTEEDVRSWVERLTGSPIYVMVLERSRAVETWLDLIGPVHDEDEDADDISFDFSRSSIGNSSLSGSKLRDVYGKGLLYGSESRTQAERQIAICAPEYASEDALADLELSMTMDPEDAIEDGELYRAQEDGCVVIGEGDLVYNEQGQAFDAHTGEEMAIEEELVPEGQGSTNGGEGHGTNRSSAPSVRAKESTQQQKIFKARPIPASLAKPTIQPRLSRAAALRMGVDMPAVPVRVTASKVAEGPVGISGLPKSDVPLPKSLAEPTLKPRANRASLARIGGGNASTSPNAQRVRKEVDFSNTPGHKRASLAPGSVASLSQPTIAPRQNRASLARVGAAGATAGPLRTMSSGSLGSAHSSDTGSAATKGRSDSQGPVERKPVDFSNTPGHKRTNLDTSKLASLKPPTIAPRTNKAAAARGGIVGGSVGGAAGKDSKPQATATQRRQSASLSSHSRSSATASPAVEASSRERRPVDFSNTPGHKRGTSFSVAALAAPKIQPRTNIAASRRLSVGGVPPSPANAPTSNGRTSSMGVSDRPASSIGHRVAGGTPGPDAAATPARSGRTSAAGPTRARPSSSAGIRSPADAGLSSSSGPAGAAAPARAAHAPLRARVAPPSAFKAPQLA